jgi:uncharacterized membrane protein YqaE (UPF0057 family)
MSDIKKRSVPISHILAAFFFPPLGVFLTVGLGAHFWINLVLTLFFTWIPGVIHAFWLLFNHNALVNKNEAKTSSLPNPNEIKYPTIDESQLNDDLSSAVGIDYRNLRNFLAVKDFESANKETKSIFQKISYMDLNSVDPDPEKTRIPRIPCTDICTINTLWVKYSEGRFGFSVQYVIWKDIYLRLCYEKQEFNRREKIETSEHEINFSAQFDALFEFYDIVGWRSGNDYCLIYQESAPKGHLPAIFWQSNTNHYFTMVGLFFRLSNCLE